MSKAFKYSFKVKNAECTKSVAAAFFVHLVNVKSLSVRATYIQLPLPSFSFSRPQRLSTPIIRLFTLRALCVSCARFETFTHKLYIYTVSERRVQQRCLTSGKIARSNFATRTRVLYLYALSHLHEE